MIASVQPMHLWPLRDLLQGMTDFPIPDSLRVSSLSLDSRALGPGALFLACQGTAHHGLEYAEQARQAAVTAILAEPTDTWSVAAMAQLQERLGIPVIPVTRLGHRAGEIAARFYGDPSAGIEVFGVTGTNGKTSVTHYLAQALQPELMCGVIGTLGNGFPGALEPTTHTTPDPVAVQATLAHLRARGAMAIAMEASSHALDQDRVGGVHFSHAIFTNLTRDHLDYHHTMAAYGAAKQKLFLTPGLRWAVINLDDPFSATLLEGLPDAVKLAACSLDPRCVPSERCALLVRARSCEELPRGLRVEVELLRAGEKAVSATLEAGVIGRFNAANLLAVLAVQCSRGLPLGRAVRELSGVRGVPGRMECFGSAQTPLVVVDYAHTPDALEKALTNLREHVQGRVVAVIGCGGDRDHGKRPLMGGIGERCSDILILTDDNPRSESGDAIIADILSGISDPAPVRIERRRALAIRLAIALAGRGDAVLVAGKGHETTQDMGERKVHFSDRAEVVEALREWQEGHH